MSGPGLDALMLGEIETALRGRSASGPPPAGTKPGAVMALFGGNAPVLYLIRRSRYVRTHRREIGFPGGKPELADGSLLETAIRETEEELGISREMIEVWGQLEPVVTGKTGFGLSVYTGLLRGEANLRPSPSEVDEVLSVPVATVLDPASQRDETRIINGAAERRPTYSYNGQIVWGATARIIAQLIEILRPRPLASGIA